MTDEKPMERIEALTQTYSEERDQLTELVQQVQTEIDRITRESMPKIKKHVRRVSEARDRLRSEVQAHPELWKKPRTVVIAGVRVGMARGKAKITWDKPEHVVKLIRRHFPEQAESMIRTKEEPIVKAIENLTISELLEIGCHVEGGRDQVVIKPTDSQVEKLVQQLLQDAERIEKQEVA